MDYKEGTVFFRKLHKDFIRIQKIETHGIKPDGKRGKLTNEVYHFEYLLNFKPPFRNYKKDIERMTSYQHWIKQ